MKGLRRFRFPWRSGATIAKELDAELEFHLDARTAELAGQGMSHGDARREAEREFGDLDGTRAYCRAQDAGLERAVRRRDWLDETRANIRYTFRSLRRSPGFTAVTLATLALAIGANTSIFSVANAILLAPLPYAEPGRLVALFENNTKSAFARSQLSAADIEDYRAAQTTLTDVAVLARNGAIVRAEADNPVALQHARVSANMFTVLGARAAYGRTFAAGEDGTPAAPVVILAYDAWVRLFNGDTTAVGRTVFLNDQPVTLVGVMPRGFGLGYAEDLYTPLDLAPQLRDVNRARKFHWLYGIARLKPGVSVELASADLNRVARDLEKRYPDVNSGHYATVMPMQTALAGSAERTAYLLLGAAALVLLVACANLINMLLARAAARSQELNIRAAIGAGRAHLVLHLVTEALVLSVAGGAIGVALAAGVTNLIVRISPTALPVLAKPSLDWRVLAFSLATSLAVGLIVGIIPALRVSRVDLSQSLRRGGRGGDRHGNTLRGVFVVSQTAMAVVLLVVGGLLVRSIQKVRNVELGFDPANTIVGTPIVRGQRYQSVEAYSTFFDAVFERLRATPGVVAVGAISGVPLLGNSGCGLVIEGRTVKGDQIPDVRCASARGDYFKAMGIRIIKGRTFDQSDLPKGPQVVVINSAIAKKFFPNEDAIGKRIKLGPDPDVPWETIIGISGDVRQNSLEEAPEPTVIEYDTQHGWGTLGIVIRMDGGDPMRVAPAFRAAVHDADPAIAVRLLRTMDEVIGLSLAQRRLTMTLIASFAGLALILAAIGIYGVLAFGVTARTREFGIRRALGATAGLVRRSVLVRGLTWAATGLAIGVVSGALVARALSSMLYGVTPYDATTFATVGVTIGAVAVLACLVPARRAMAVDPVIAMRAE